MDPAPLRTALNSPDPTNAALAALTAFHGLRPVEMRTLQLTDIRDSRATLLAEYRELTETGKDRPLSTVLFYLGELDCRTGHWPRALRYADEGLHVAALVNDEFRRSLHLAVRGLAQALQGDLDSARATAHEGLEVAKPAGGAAIAAGVNLALLGFVELSAGDHAAALRHLQPLAAHLPTNGGFDPGLTRFVPDTVETLVALGDVDGAAGLLTPFEAKALALDRPWALATAGRCRALLCAASGDQDSALAALTAALAAHDRLELPFERARTLLVAGTIHRRAKHRREARNALHAALAIFEQLGSASWTNKARDELRRIGGRSPTAQGLTPTEQRIATLVTTGQTNREVAAELFVTIATVESALWKIYRKLGVRSRTELAARTANPPHTP